MNTNPFSANPTVRLTTDPHRAIAYTSRRYAGLVADQCNRDHSDVATFKACASGVRVVANRGEGVEYVAGFTN